MLITNSNELIHVESGRYPLYLRDVRRENITKSLPASPTEASINNLGYAVVHPTARPIGDVVTRGAPVLEDGVWKQTWNVRPFTPEELQTRLEEVKTKTLKDIEDYREKLLAYGVEYDFGDGVGHIQVRDGDRANLAGLRLDAEAAIREENTAFMRVFRDREDQMHTLDAEGIIAMTNAALAGYYQILQDVWELKDLTKLAETIDDIPEVPVI